MADEFSLSIDTDWKKQAQEEKRKLVEEQQKKAAAAPAVGAVKGTKPDAAQRGRRQVPTANFATLVQTLTSQALFYLGELTADGSEGNVNLDRAKHQVDTLTVLEEKTVNNLTPEEQFALDTALYEVRMRFVNVASQYI